MGSDGVRNGAVDRRSARRGRAERGGMSRGDWDCNYNGNYNRNSFITENGFEEKEDTEEGQAVRGRCAGARQLGASGASSPRLTHFGRAMKARWCQPEEADLTPVPKVVQALAKSLSPWWPSSVPSFSSKQFSVIKLLQLPLPPLPRRPRPRRSQTVRSLRNGYRPRISATRAGSRVTRRIPDGDWASGTGSPQGSQAIEPPS